VTLPGFVAAASLSPAYTRNSGVRRPTAVAGVQPAQITNIDPCLFGAHINVAWQPFFNGRSGAVVVTGGGFAPRRLVRVEFDNCTSAFPELGFATTNACGEFMLLHTCTCSGPPIGVQATDAGANSASGSVRQTC